MSRERPVNHLPVARGLLARRARAARDEPDVMRADAVLDAIGVLERDPEAGHELRDARTVRVVAIHHRGQAYETDPS